MSRNRPSTCPAAPTSSRQSRPGSARYRHSTALTAPGSGSSRCPPQRLTAKSSIPKRGPPPAPPKKIDYKNPQMTRAMHHKMKHTQKYQEELERKECQQNQQPTRRSRSSRPPSSTRRPDSSRHSRGPPVPETLRPLSTRRGMNSQGVSRSRGSSRDMRCPGAAMVTEHTINLAKTFNADIVQAEPMQKGPVDNIIIPPGTINSDKTTIVSIPLGSTEARPRDSGIEPQAMMRGHDSVKPANKSVKIINETLDEQDAVEYEVMNSKLQDLQHARRDLMLTVAGFGTNSISEENGASPEIADVSPRSMLQDSPDGLYPYPDPNDPYFKPEYGMRHPVVEAAREYLRCRQSERKFEDEFAKIATGEAIDDLRPPKDFLEYSDDDDDDDDDYDDGGTSYTRRNAYEYDPLEVDRLERFLDTKNYPVSPRAPRSSPPAGRRGLPPDLWDIEDPWYSEPDGPDLIDWNSPECH